jgi:hypothetical protein
MRAVIELNFPDYMRETTVRTAVEDLIAVDSDKFPWVIKEDDIVSIQPVKIKKETE